MCSRCGSPPGDKLCRRCRRRERRIEKGLPVAPTEAERFLAAYRVDESGCWLWQLSSSGHGYGQFSVNGRQVRAHRYSYEYHVGPIPDGLVIDHLCRVTTCVRPDHLEPVTPAENTRRGVAIERATAWALAKTHCKQGHAFTADNTYIDPRGWRSCRTCRRVSSARYARAS